MKRETERAVAAVLLVLLLLYFLINEFGPGVRLFS